MNCELVFPICVRVMILHRAASDVAVLHGSVLGRLCYEAITKLLSLLVWPLFVGVARL